MARLPLLFTTLVGSGLALRTTYYLNHAWKFELAGSGPTPTCPADPTVSFPTSLDGQQCLGLNLVSAAR